MAKPLNTESLWQALRDESSPYPKLTRDLKVDVAIVGAGITGITAALQLTRAGRKVAIVEALKVGKGTTGDSTGNLYVAVQPYYHFIQSQFGEEAVKTIALSRKFSIDFIESLVKEKRIDCFFHRRPWYLYSSHRRNDRMIDKEFETLRQAGLEIEYVETVPLPFRVSKAIKMEKQARFDPLKYLSALAADLAQQGCLIFEETRFLGVEEKGDCVVQTTGGKITARQLILATHIPKGFHILQSLALPYRSYAVAARLKSGRYPNANFWDTNKPHHATSTHSTSSAGLDLLVVADSHHPTGNAPKKNHLEMFRQIEKHLHRHYDVASIEYRWSAQHYQAPDGVPYIGRAGPSSKNIYLATGYFADGLPYGTLAGILLSDLIQGKKNPWAQVYDPSRISSKAAKKFNKSVKAARQYQGGSPKNLKSKRFAAIGTGQAKTLTIQGEKLAAYRDEKRRLHVVSAVCTHMQCTVKWNNAERSWDCPCHGSRFTFDGEVIEGPAISPLQQSKIL